METLVARIDCNELKKYITARHCYFNNSVMIIQPKFGVVTFDFTSFNVSRCIVKISRKSGNGLLLASSGAFQQEVQIISNHPEDKSFNLLDGRLRIHRMARSMGEICIHDISLYGEREEVNWNQILKSVEEYSCLRLLGTDLVASDGSFIRGSNISEVVTNPPDMFIKDGDKVTFKGSCVVKKISLTPVDTAQQDYIKSIEPVSPFNKTPIESNTLIKNEFPRINRTLAAQPPQHAQTHLRFDKSANEINEIKQRYRYFSVLAAEEYDVDKIDISAGIGLYTFQAKLWYSWIAGMMPNLSYESLTPIHNSRYSEDVNLSICSINNIHGERVFIEEFASIPESSIGAIKEAKKIFTPSIVNLVQLAQYNENVEVSTLPLPVPFRSYNTGVGDDVFCFSDSCFTESVANNWQNGYGKLSVFDPENRVVDDVIPVSIYTKYDDLVARILRSKALIRLTANTNHKSSFIDFALSNGIHCVTNNVQYIMSDKVTFIGPGKGISENVFAKPLERVVNFNNCKFVDDFKRLVA